MKPVIGVEMLRDDDILRSLLHLSGSQRPSTGEYHQEGYWSVRLSTDDSQSRMVATHEALHGSLNFRTSFGQLLTILAMVVAQKPRTISGVRLGDLVEYARLTHEMYATAGGSWIAGITPLELVSAYPSYQTYLELAQSIAPSCPNGSLLKLLVIEQTARAAMQAPLIEDVIEANTLELHVLTPTNEQRPDERLSRLIDSTDESTWNDLIDESCSVLPPHTRLAWEQPISDIARTISTSDVFNGREKVARQLFSRIALSLRALGLPTLDFNGHQAELRKLNGYVLQVAPEISSQVRFEQDNDDALLLFEGESLRFADRTPVMKVINLDEVNKKHLIAGFHPHQHVFLAARPTRRVLHQNELSEFDWASVVETSDHGVTLFCRASSLHEGRRHVLASPIETPNQLERLKSIDLTSTNLVASISMSVIGLAKWRERWLGSLRYTRMTGLFDLPPITLLRKLALQGAEIKYAVINIEVDSQRVDVFSCQLGKPYDFPFLAPVSPMLAQVLSAFIEENFGFRAERGSAFMRESRDILSIAIGHVLREETLFDFDGGSDLLQGTPS